MTLCHAACNGSTADLKASERNSELVFSAKLNNVKTGIGLRDEHLKKYLEIGKFPEATLTVAKDKLQMAQDQGTVTSTPTGKFTLHGIARPVAPATSLPRGSTASNTMLGMLASTFSTPPWHSSRMTSGHSAVAQAR